MVLVGGCLTSVPQDMQTFGVGLRPGDLDRFPNQIEVNSTDSGSVLVVEFQVSERTRYLLDVETKASWRSTPVVWFYHNVVKLTGPSLMIDSAGSDDAIPSCPAAKSTIHSLSDCTSKANWEEYTHLRIQSSLDPGTYAILVAAIGADKTSHNIQFLSNVSVNELSRTVGDSTLIWTKPQQSPNIQTAAFKLNQSQWMVMRPFRANVERAVAAQNETQVVFGPRNDVWDSAGTATSAMNQVLASGVWNVEARLETVPREASAMLIGLFAGVLTADGQMPAFGPATDGTHYSSWDPYREK